MLKKAPFLKFSSLLLGLLVTGMMTVVASANPIIPISTQSSLPMITPTAPTLDAKGYILMDANSGKVLAEKNADMHMSPASLTKLMSVYIIASALRAGTIHPDDKVRISTKAWQTGGSRMFVKANDEVPVKDLLRGIIVASGNDASVAMAEYLAGSEDSFATIMNQQAKLLGMNNTHFVDSTGLPNPDHFSTPRDLAILATAIAQNFPEEYKIFSDKWFVYNNIRQPNRNRLLWRFPYADGLKTGHTDDAGYCLVSSATKDGTRLIGVVMGAPNDNARTEDSIRLLTFGFRFFETHKINDATKPLAMARVWKGTQKEVALGLTQPLFVTMPAGQYKNVQVNVQINNPIKAPVVKGQAYGTLNIVLNNLVLASKPLIALSDDPKGGMWRSLSDAVSYSFEKLFSKSNDKANNG